VRIGYGLVRKSAIQPRKVPLQESHLPTAKLPHCPTVLGILRPFEEGFSGTLRKGISKGEK
jgi:hypothetical protein